MKVTILRRGKVVSVFDVNETIINGEVLNDELTKSLSLLYFLEKDTGEGVQKYFGPTFNVELDKGGVSVSPTTLYTPPIPKKIIRRKRKVS